MFVHWHNIYKRSLANCKSSVRVGRCVDRPDLILIMITALYMTLGFTEALSNGTDKQKHRFDIFTIIYST